MAKTLTAANSVILFTIPDLFSAPQQLQGFATEDVVDTDAIETAETMMGVDGRLSAGWVPREIKQTYALQADSNSVELFEAWYQSQKAVRDIYFAKALIHLPSTGKKYTLNRGVLTTHSAMPNVKKVLQSRSFVVTWESFTSGAAI